MPDPFTTWTVKQKSPQEWGARIDYDNPEAWAAYIHKPIPGPLDFKGYCFHYWGGNTVAGDPGDPDPGWGLKQRVSFWLGRTFATVRSGEAWHLAKGWRGIAYCCVISPWTGHLLRCRGYRDNGGQLGATLNHTLLAVAWCGGGTQKPLRRARRCFARMWAEYPGPVWCHKDTAGANTSCPGDYWTPWVREQGWLKDLGVLKLRKIPMRNGRVLSLTKRLTDLGYLPGKQAKYDQTVAAAVGSFKADHALPADMIVDERTWQALGTA